MATEDTEDETAADTGNDTATGNDAATGNGTDTPTATGTPTGTEHAPRATAPAGGMPRWALVLSIVAGLALLVGVMIAARIVTAPDEADPDAPVTPAALAPAPDAGSRECGQILGALGDTLGDAHRVDVEGDSPATAAYRMPDASAVVVRCGLATPPGFVVGSALQQVNGVQWFSEQDPDPSVTETTWVTVDRARTVALTLPSASGSGPIQDLSDLITTTMPAVAPKPAPAR